MTKYAAANKKTANHAYSSYSLIFLLKLLSEVVGSDPAAAAAFVDGPERMFCVRGLVSLLIESDGGECWRLATFLRRLISPDDDIGRQFRYCRRRLCCCLI